MNMKACGRNDGACLPGACSQSGVTLVELMISMAIGMFVVMAATALLVSTKSGYLIQDDEAQIQASGRFAIDMVSRAVRHVKSWQFQNEVERERRAIAEASRSGGHR